MFAIYSDGCEKGEKEKPECNYRFNKHYKGIPQQFVIQFVAQ
jgi:hypothetical protein